MTSRISLPEDRPRARTPVEDRNLTRASRMAQAAHRLATADRKARAADRVLTAARADAAAAAADVLPMLTAEQRAGLAGLLVRDGPDPAADAA